jgi:hypothetical protein
MVMASIIMMVRVGVSVKGTCDDYVGGGEGAAEGDNNRVSEGWDEGEGVSECDMYM